MPAKFQQETLKSRFAQAKVLVVGDVMLDRYWFGDVSRISPEAPVPVAKIGRIDQRAGGAANVARNIASLGGRAGLLSVTGDDEAAAALDALMVQDGVASYLMRDKQIATTVKLRVVARNQQLIRLDFEEHPNREVLEQIKRKYREILPEYDAIIFSDYGKGGLSHISDMIDWAKHVGKTVLIDPKGDDYEKYVGATLITPNCAELKEVVGSWKKRRRSDRKSAKPAPPPRLDRRFADPERRGHDPVQRRRTHLPAHPRPRSLRRVRRRRHRHCRNGLGAGGRLHHARSHVPCQYCGRGCRGETRYGGLLVCRVG